MQSTTTEHYVHIPTEKVIDDMATLGWNVVDAKQVARLVENVRLPTTYGCILVIMI